MTDRTDKDSMREDTPAAGLDRRSLLRAGAATAAGAVLLRGSRARAQAAVLDDSLATEYLEFEGGSVDEEECKPHETGLLPDVDEDCETVLGLLWTDFLRSAYTAGARDIALDAAEYGRRSRRRWAYEAVDTYGLRAVLTFAYPAERARWEQAAGEVGNDAVVTLPKLQGAFDGEFGNEANPRWLSALEDRATETIGAHLWLRFTVGVMERGGNELATEVIRAGRVRSRAFVRRHVARNVIVMVDGAWTIEYGNWAKDTVGGCAYRAGRRAADLAGNGTITEEEFETAWCQEAAIMARFLRQKRIATITSGACG